MPARSLPIEHRPQEVDAGCLAACAQMTLAAIGITASQTDLNRIFELTPAGVPLSRLARLERLGVRVTIQSGNVDKLTEAVDQGTPPIVFIRTGELSYWNNDVQHAVVVSGYDGYDFMLNDPAFSSAPQRVSGDELMLAWTEFDYVYAILARRSGT